MPDETYGGMDGLEWGLAAVKARRDGYVLHRDYHEGRHRLAFATAKFRQHFGTLFDSFRDNLCAPIVDALVDRLMLESWQTPGDEGAGDPGQVATEVWDANRMQLRQVRTHLEAVRCGDAFELVWPTNAGEVRIWPQEPTAMAVQYDEEDDPTRILRAAKVWQRLDGRWRVNIYTPTTIERWATPNKREEQPTRAQYLNPWTEDEAGEEVANPWGRPPVFHFPNGSEAGEWGRSELADVLPLQDALNKSMADMLVAMEFVALPQRVLIGVEADVDPETGLERKLDAGADRLWRLRNANASVTQFAGADLTQFLKVQEALRLEAARIAGTPPHYLMLGNTSGLGQTPSGEALHVLEGRLTRRAERLIASWGDVRTAELQLAVAMRAGPGTDPEAVPHLEPVWADPSSASPTLELELAERKLRVGYSQRQVWRELGLDDPQIEAMEDELRDQASQLGDALLSQFDRGNVATGIGGGAFPAAT